VVYDNAGLPAAHQRNLLPHKGRLDEIVERSLRQAALWDEVKNRLNKSGLGLSGGQAQAASASPARSPRAGRRADGRAGSALDPIARARSRT